MDMKDWSGRLFGCDDDTQIFVTEQWRGFIREIIADEREAAKAQPQPVESGAEVPEWCKQAAVKVAREFPATPYIDQSYVDTMARHFHKAAESDHARRVAEAVEAKDKRIAELEERNRDLLESIMSAYTKLGLHEGNVPGNENLSDTLHRHIAALRQQLAASQAEVERLRNQLNLEIASGNARLDELAKLREENARLSRPVEGVKAHEILVVRRSGMSVERGVAVADFQRERNAREAAESLIGEVIERLNADTHDGTTAGCWQCELVKKLAAFRAEKGKVQQ